MTGYDLYVFFLCLFVFILLTGLSVFTVVTIVKMTIKLIHFGDEDEYILKLFDKKTQKKEKIKQRIDTIVSLLICIVLLAAFAIATSINMSEDKFSEDFPTYRVICSESMGSKHPSNHYLVDNKLDNQIQMFDIAKFEKVTSEAEIQLYDIVVYEIDEILVCHRIVEMKETKDGVVYILQGDAVGSPDYSPVKYSQIKAEYTGEKIKFVGSFVLFLQSPAGWLCIALTIFTIFAPLI